MKQINRSEHQIEFVERLPTLGRGILFLVGLLPWKAVYDLLIKPGWTEFNLFTLFFLVISLGAIAVSLAFLGAALLGLDQTLRFDAKSRTVQYIHGSTLMKLKEKRYPFREVAKIEVYTHEWESRPYTYGLEFAFSDQRKVKMGDVAEKEDAEALRDTLLGWVKSPFG